MVRPATAAALARLNRDFYRRHGAAFSRTRQAPWPGWERLAGLLEQSDAARHGRLSILDLGCGNGRFARFLARRLSARCDYLGVDASLPLLAEARRALAPLGNGPLDSVEHHTAEPGAGPAAGAARRPGFAALRLAALDLLESPSFSPGAPTSPLLNGAFDLVALLGVLHHVPGRAARRALIERAAAHLGPGGLLALTFWQFGHLSRFRDRVVPWAKTDDTEAAPLLGDLDPHDLEPGDVLLRWGPDPPDGSPSPCRYCHFSDPDEVEALTAGLALDPLATYRADGATADLNLYRILRAPEAR